MKWGVRRTPYTPSLRAHGLVTKVLGLAAQVLVHSRAAEGLVNITLPTYPSTHTLYTFKDSEQSWVIMIYTVTGVVCRWKSEQVCIIFLTRVADKTSRACTSLMPVTTRCEGGLEVWSSLHKTSPKDNSPNIIYFVYIYIS